MWKSLFTAQGFVISVLIAFLIAGVLIFFAKWGRVTAKSLIKNSWKALFLFIVIAAALSPTTDPLNILLNAAPMVVLYALSIGIAHFLHPAQLQETGQVN